MDRDILKGSAWLLAAQGFVKIVSFLYTLFLASRLGVENFGLYVVALSYFSLVSSLADFGVSRYIIREGAIARFKLDNLLSAAIILRLTILSCFFVVFVISVYILDPDKLRGVLSMLAVLAVIPQGVAFTLDAAFITISKLQFSALGLLVLSLSTSIIGVYMINNNLGVFGALIGLICGQIIYALTLVAVSFIKKIRFLNFHSGEKLLTEVASGSIPYGLLAVLGLLYFKIDSLILGYIRGSYEAGIYGAAYKFLESILFIPAAFSAALMPRLARLHESDLSQLKKTYFKSLKFLFILSVPVLLGFIFILPVLIKTYLPSFNSSISAIYILALTIPFIFLHVPGAAMLLSTNKYLKPILKLSLLTLSLNVLLNFIFIPKFGFIAASYVTVGSEVLTFILFYMLLNRLVFR